MREETAVEGAPRAPVSPGNVNFVEIYLSRDVYNRTGGHEFQTPCFYLELAALPRLEQMQSVRMLKQRAIWVREKCFDRIEVIIEMHEETLRRLYAGFDPELLYNGLYSPRRQPTLDELALDTEFEVESLRLKALLSQLPPPPKYCLSPRRSPAAATGWAKPGVPHPEMQQMAQAGTFSFQVSVNGFLHVDSFKVPEQEGTSILSSRRWGKP